GLICASSSEPRRRRRRERTMSPGSNVKSEYKKSFQDPRWEEHGRYYRELLLYRWGRRLLEQAHVPWLWEDWGCASASDDSASSVSSSSQGPVAQCAPALSPRCEEPAAQAEADPQVPRTPEEQGSGAGRAEAEDAALPGTRPKGNWASFLTKVPDFPQSLKSNPKAKKKGNRKAARSPQSSRTIIKEKKCPFALYGCGEKKMITGSQKTHNVCASAPVHKIHESALQAKNRRQMAKRKFATQR
uniref:Centriole, cilia and spindle associated protein n=1 Tax=Otolemur garnettii TaxID=30611 RepID=H0WYB1_OTOGA